jgi:quercetin dioxygenase-like cupin family protein
VHAHGRLEDAPASAGAYAGSSTGYLRRVLFGRAEGSVHQEAAVCELDAGGSVDRHVHAFEEALYVLDGELEIEVAGTTEQLGPDDHLFVERGVSHALRSDAGARWFEVAAPQPGATAIRDTVFVPAPKQPDGLETPYRRGHFDAASLPEPSSAIGLAGVGGAALEILVGPATGASQILLMVVQYAPGGFITLHDHAFEEGFFFLTGEVEAVLDDATVTIGAGGWCWSGVGSMHALTNRSDDVVRWLETQAPHPPSRHQARFTAEWERYLDGA